MGRAFLMGHVGITNHAWCVEWRWGINVRADRRRIRDEIKLFWRDRCLFTVSVICRSSDAMSRVHNLRG